METLAELCYERKQHFAIERHYPDSMTNKTPARVVLRQNLDTLMQRSIDLDTQPKLAKRAGVSQRTVSNLLREAGPKEKGPRLDVVEKIARAFGLSTWQLLLDPKAVGEDLATLLLRPAVRGSRRRRGRNHREDEEWSGEERRGTGADK